MLQFTLGYGVLTVDPLRLQTEPGAIMNHEFDFVSSAHQFKTFWNVLRAPKHLVHNSPLLLKNTAAHLVPAIGKCDAPEPNRQQISDLPDSMTRGSDKRSSGATPVYKLPRFAASGVRRTVRGARASLKDPLVVPTVAGHDAGASHCA
jgi:hypothetical protein